MIAVLNELKSVNHLHYYDENTSKNSNHQKRNHGGSLPEYMREAGNQSDSGDDSSADMSDSPLSLDSISLPGSNYQSTEKATRPANKFRKIYAVYE